MQNHYAFEDALHWSNSAICFKSTRHVCLGLEALLAAGGCVGHGPALWRRKSRRCRPWRARTPRSCGLACLLAAREEDIRCVCVGRNAVMPQPSRRPTMQGTAPPAFDRQRVADRAAGCAGSIGWGTSATTLSGRISSITNDFL